MKEMFATEQRLNSEWKRIEFRFMASMRDPIAPLPAKSLE
jgi:hypothetical protein